MSELCIVEDCLSVLIVSYLCIRGVDRQLILAHIAASSTSGLSSNNEFDNNAVCLFLTNVFWFRWTSNLSSAYEHRIKLLCFVLYL